MGVDPLTESRDDEGWWDEDTGRYRIHVWTYDRSDEEPLDD